MGKETADQKLQKIIENSGSMDSSQGQKNAKKISDAVKGTGVSGLGTLFAGQPNAAHSKSIFGLREFNQLMIVLIAIILVLFVFDLINGSKKMQSPMNLSIESSLGKKFSTPTPAPKRLSNYLSLIEVRNIFQPYEKKQQEAVVEPVQQSSDRMTSMTQKLKLVGISWLDSAETASVMIEDSETGMTYFAKQGDRVKDFTVKNIYTDRIILTYEDEEVVIKL